MIKQIQNRKQSFFSPIPIQIQNTDKFQLIIPYRRSISVQNGDDLPDTISRIPPKQNTTSRRMHHIIAFPRLYLKKRLVRLSHKNSIQKYHPYDNMSLDRDYFYSVKIHSIVDNQC
jgi:hypothetical protein